MQVVHFVVMMETLRSHPPYSSANLPSFAEMFRSPFRSSQLSSKSFTRMPSSLLPSFSGSSTPFSDLTT